MRPASDASGPAGHVVSGVGPGCPPEEWSAYLMAEARTVLCQLQRLDEAARWGAPLHPQSIEVIAARIAALQRAVATHHDATPSGQLRAAASTARDDVRRALHLVRGILRRVACGTPDLPA